MIDNIIVLNTLNNRERAIIVWLIIFFTWALFHKSIRNSMLNLIKMFVSKYFLKVIFVMLLYIGIVVYFLVKIHYYHFSLIKDTIFWTFGSAFILLMNSTEALHDQLFFRKQLLNSIKFALLLEFIVNLYAFNYWIEILTFPIISVIVVLDVFATSNVEYAIVKRFSQFVLSIYGLFLVTYTLIKIFRDFDGFGTIENLRSFLLPIILTVAYMPFLYLFTLNMAYDSLNARLKWSLKDNAILFRYAKQQIFKLCLFDLKKLNKFMDENVHQFHGLQDKKTILSLVQTFKSN